MTTDPEKIAAELLEDIQKDSKKRRRLNRPQWMNGPTERESLSESERRKRRKLNKANRKLRSKVRGRRKHGRPVGR